MHGCVNPSEGADNFAAIWQEAYELNYRNRLLGAISDAENESPRSESPLCQLVFCIDVRSEPIRREIEKLGPYATYGFAGFFGVPVCFKELGSSVYKDLCPVLLKPQKQAREVADTVASRRKESYQAMLSTFLQLRKRLKSNLAASFGLVELMGLGSAFSIFVKTFLPRFSKKIGGALENKLAGQNSSSLDLHEFSLKEKIEYAGAVLKAIGLDGVYSRLVVLCGHGSSSTNNPYASALDCGACGGNAGRYSARLLADILNDRDVRKGLLEKNIGSSGRRVGGSRVLAAQNAYTERIR